MELKNAIFAASFIIFVFGVAIFLSQQPQTQPAGQNNPVLQPIDLGSIQKVTTAKKPLYTNINAYAAETTAEKPEAVLAKFAETETGTKASTEVTIYNQDLALVKEKRNIDLANGLNLVKYEDIAKYIKPETVLFTDLTDSDAFVVEQNYQFDLASNDKILEKYLGKTITVSTKGPESQQFTGKLLSFSGSSVV